MHNKILIVGNFNWYFYEDALIEGLKALNTEVLKFNLKTFDFKSKILNYKELKNCNNNLLNFVKENQPDAIFFYRTNEVIPVTLKKIKKVSPETKILFYNNDNPFFGFKNKIKYFLYLSCLKHTDITYVYRPSNIEDARKWKAKKILLLYPHYCTKLHVGKKIEYKDKINDIVFVGHYEKDRGDYVNALITANINIKVFGPGWDAISKTLNWPDMIVNEPVYGDKYRKTISESKMALCFLSKINNDVYTRRNFEIPAIGTIVVSEFTKELSELFIPNEEIILFNDEKDLVTQVKSLFVDDSFLKRLTLAGQDKVKNGAHSELDRAIQIHNDILELN
jgi:spore maturation protein CgeB